MTSGTAGTADRLPGGDLPWIAAICGYFLFQTLYRRALGGGLGLDEAQMLLWGGHLAWGYGPQPPLYSWLQWGVFRLVPDPLLALSLLKNALLAAFYLAVYALLRSAHPPRIAGTAAICLFLCPQIAWDSQRDMTHSVLVMTLSAATALAFWRAALGGRPGGWVLLGLCVGLGLIAKPNYSVVPLALLAAALTLPELRRRLRPGGIAACLAVAAIIVAGPVIWVARHPDRALASAPELHRAGTDTGLAAGALSGLAAVAGAAFACLGLAVVVCAAVAWLRRRSVPVAPSRPVEELLWRSVAIGLALVAAGVLATRTTSVRDLWLLPTVYLAAPLGALAVLRRTGEPGARLLRRIVAGLAVLVFVALGVHMRYGDPGHPTIRRAPVPQIAEMLEARFPGTLIVADPEWLAGNLRFRRPDLPVMPADAPGDAPPPGAPVVLVWWNGKDGSLDRLTAALSQAWGRAVAADAPETFAAPFPPQPDVSFRVEAAPLDIGAASPGDR